MPVLARFGYKPRRWKPSEKPSKVLDSADKVRSTALVCVCFSETAAGAALRPVAVHCSSSMPLLRL